MLTLRHLASPKKVEQGLKKRHAYINGVAPYFPVFPLPPVSFWGLLHMRIQFHEDSEECTTDD